MSTWPQGVITPQGADDLLDGTDPNIWFTGDDGSKKFYTMGGLAPFPGVQAGIICTEHPAGMAATAFKHLDTQGAKQDGVTYQGTVFDPTKITFKFDVHARDAATLSRIVDEWMGMWHPRKQVLCEYITPDGGYWRGLLRLLPDSWKDNFKLTPRRLGVWSMTHNCRIDTTFWETISVQDTWAPTFESFSDDFTTPTTQGLGPNWATIASKGHTGYVYVGADGQVHWHDTGNAAQSVLNAYLPALTETDNQVVTVTVGTNWQSVQLFGDATVIIGARMDLQGNGVFCEIAWNLIEIYSVTAGVRTTMYQNLLLTPMRPGETWQFVAGAVANVPRSFAVFRNGVEVAVFAEHGTNSPVGSGNRHAGFGQTSAEGILAESRPAPVGRFAAADNTAVSASGYIELSNQGTEDAYPYILMYGPGTWAFGDGPNSTNMITVGPLTDGQILFLSTLPRQQKVIDMTPANMQPNPDAQAAIDAQLTKMFGGNMPILAADYASLFGIIPAQGNLQGLVSGLFDTPIPGVDTPQDVALSQIPVSITDGTATSKIIMAVTPRRIHPA